MTDLTRTFPAPASGGPTASADARPDADLVLDLAAEYHAAKEAGGRPDLSDVCRQRPDLLPRVRELLGLGDDLNALAGMPPDTLGRYAVLGLLGSGGMGDVYRATDTAFGREVALKVLQPKFGPASAAARRFADEARITGQLQHPSIPAVHDLGTLPDGRPFLAMKLVKGDTLDDLLKARPSPSAERGKFLAVFEQVCHAVAYAHARSVIHRDLKPHNVMVGAFGEVQVMDWGLAKVLASGGRQPPVAADTESTATAINSLRDSDGEFTHAGSVLGTPAYISPEQAIGAVDQIDRQSDVFGLGGILCAILTGKPPFVGDTAESTRQLAAKGKLGDAFARLDASGAEPDLVTLCKRCLAAEKSDRPADADVVAKAVAALRAAAAERARRAEIDRENAAVREAEQRKRRRAERVVVFLVAVGALVGIGALWWADRQAKERAAEQTARERAAEQTVALAADTVAALVDAGDKAVADPFLWRAYLAQARSCSDRAVVTRNNLTADSEAAIRFAAAVARLERDEADCQTAELCRSWIPTLSRTLPFGTDDLQRERKVIDDSIEDLFARIGSPLRSTSPPAVVAALRGHRLRYQLTVILLATQTSGKSRTPQAFAFSAHASAVAADVHPLQQALKRAHAAKTLDGELGNGIGRALTSLELCSLAMASEFEVEAGEKDEAYRERLMEEAVRRPPSDLLIGLYAQTVRANQTFRSVGRPIVAPKKQSVQKPRELAPPPRPVK